MHLDSGWNRGSCRGTVPSPPSGGGEGEGEGAETLHRAYLQRRCLPHSLKRSPPSPPTLSPADGGEGARGDRDTEPTQNRDAHPSPPWEVDAPAEPMRTLNLLHWLTVCGSRTLRSALTVKPYQIGCLSFVAIALLSLGWWLSRWNRQLTAEYTTAQVIRSVIEYVETHNGAWPQSWDDLNGSVHDKKYVQIDFQADSGELLRTPSRIQTAIQVTGKYTTYPHAARDLNRLLDVIREHHKSPSGSNGSEVEANRRCPQWSRTISVIYIFVFASAASPSTAFRRLIQLRVVPVVLRVDAEDHEADRQRAEQIVVVQFRGTAAEPGRAESSGRRPAAGRWGGGSAGRRRSSAGSRGSSSAAVRGSRFSTRSGSEKIVVRSDVPAWKLQRPLAGHLPVHVAARESAASAARAAAAPGRSHRPSAARRPETTIRSSRR